MQDRSHTLIRRMANSTRTGSSSAPAEAGMVATSQPLAVRAGVEALAAGGTATDAAIAAAAVLCVVEPRATGVGGDAFALYWPAGAAEPIALDGAGPAAAAATVDAVRASGHDRMPSTGPWTVTVPGAVATWARLEARHGRLGLDRLLAPAIQIANEGFEVTPTISEEWAMHASRIADNAAAAAVFLPGGRALRQSVARPPARVDRARGRGWLLPGSGRRVDR
jgi:gamma-glutamyltranspeptidase / glutathione hydrolase